MKQVLLFLLPWLAVSQVNHAQTLVWSTLMENTNTLSSPRSADLNADGILDIVCGAGIEGQSTESGITAFNGSDGSILWNLPVRDEVFGSATFHDINGDDKPDILIGGRNAQLYAIDGSNGNLIWEYYTAEEVDAGLPETEGVYQFYNLQIIPDQNNDGLKDILSANGGDKNAGPTDPDRPPGHIMVIDALNGSPLAMAVVPDSSEVYMSPLIHDFESNGELDIIFGTGGETFEGSLWRTTLTALMNNDISDAIELRNGNGKGILAPPSLADLNNDGILDIIASMFGELVVAIDGSTNANLWTVDIPNSAPFFAETIITPAIGLFVGNDNIPDVFVVHGIGETPFYVNFHSTLINGATGETVYTETNNRWSIISPIALDYDADGYDEVIMIENTPIPSDPYAGQLMLLDFNDNTKTELTTLGEGFILYSTPHVTDLDGDGNLDLIYSNLASGETLAPGSGYYMKRLDLGIPSTGYIAWGAYMGNNYDGIYTPSPFIDLCADFDLDLIGYGLSCYDSGDGRVEATVYGASPFQYSWNGSPLSAPITANTYNLDNLDAGNFTLYVVDANGCSNEVNVSLPQPDEILIETITIPESSIGSNDGSIEITIQGGIPPLDISYDGTGGTISGTTISGLGSGNYTITVSDVLGCSNTVAVNLSVGISATFNEQSICLFPNPSSTIFWVDLANLTSSKTATIAIYDKSGRAILATQALQFSNNAFDSSSYTPGLYHIIITIDGMPFIRKLLIY